MKGSVREAFEMVHVPEQLRQSTAEKMLSAAKNKRTVWKAAAAFCMLLLILAGTMFFPGNNGKPDGLAFSVYAADGKDHKEIPLSGSAVQITLDNDKKYRSGGMGGVGNSETMTWEELIDFNLHCTGRGDIKHVTYTAHNCEFLKKSFFTQEQKKDGEASNYADGSLWSETDQAGNEITWGFSPVGYVYSADYMEQVNLKNFGLKITYEEKKSEEYRPFTVEESAKFEKLREQAYENAYISAEIELENGRIINKTIKIGFLPGYGKVTAWIVG